MYNEWSLDIFYKGIDDPAFSQDMAMLDRSIKDYKAVISSLSYDDTAKTLRQIIDLKESITVLVRRLMGYLSLRRSTNSSDTEVSVPQTKLSMLMTSVARENVIFEKYVGGIEDLDAVLDSDEVLSQYKFYFNEVKESVSHNMSDEAEDVFARMNMSGGRAWGDLTSYLTSTLEVEYDGKITTLPYIRGLAESDDAEVRKAAYEAELASYRKVKDAIAFSLNSIKAQVNTEAELRGYENPLAITLAQSRMKKETLDAMFEAMREYMPKFREYLKHKAKLLGHKNGLPWYDIYQPVGNAVSKPYTVEEAHKYLVEHFASFSPDMSEMMDKAFKEDWIDFYSRPGKSGGAFCYGLTWFGEARILTNFAGNFGAVNTLAHELGHAFHSMQTKLNRPLNRLNPLPVSETASTFNEIFLMNDAIANAVGDDKIALLDKQITDALMILPDMYIRYRTEDELINRRRKGFVYADEINKLMTDTQKEVYGDALDNDYLYPYIWCDKSHYYSAKRTYYNYPYAFGGLFGRGLYAKYLEEGDSFVPKYREMLRQTPMKTVENAALVMGIDLSDVNFWRKSISTVCESIDLFIKETSK